MAHSSLHGQITEMISSRSKTFWKFIEEYWAMSTRSKVANSGVRKCTWPLTYHPVQMTLPFWWNASFNGWTRKRQCPCIQLNMRHWLIISSCTFIHSLMAMAVHLAYWWTPFLCGPVIHRWLFQSNKGNHSVRSFFFRLQAIEKQFTTTTPSKLFASIQYTSQAQILRFFTNSQWRWYTAICTLHRGLHR